MKKPANLAQQLDHMLRQAVALQQNGALAEAQELYREILELKPRHFDALQLLGALALQGGRIEEGVDLLSKALAVNPKQSAVHSNLAYALNALHRFDEALASANRALALQPQFPDALNNRGNAQAGLDQPLDALASFDRAIALAADFAQAWNNRACVLRDLGRPADALASCDRALALQPGYAEAWSNRGNALSDMNEPHEAERSYQRALELAPGFVDAWNNLGLTQIDQDQHAQALASYQRALALNPEAAETHWNEALCLLQMGQLETGWQKYEWRWERSRIKASRRVMAQPFWLGDFSLAGKTILLHAEQGLGDTLQFCRYAAMVARLGAKVVLEVQPELRRLMSTLDGVNQIVEAGEPLPPFDCHCPLLSLPLALRTDLASIPSSTPYLLPSPLRRAHGVSVSTPTHKAASRSASCGPAATARTWRSFARTTRAVRSRSRASRRFSICPTCSSSACRKDRRRNNCRRANGPRMSWTTPASCTISPTLQRSSRTWIWSFPSTRPPRISPAHSTGRCGS